MVSVMDSNNLPLVDVPVIQKNVSPSLGTVLGDIESRMPPGHIYRFPDDLITWAHETTHGLNSRVRNANYKPGTTPNAFYVLEGKALLLQEPKGLLLSDVARRIPTALRGKIYKLYMIDQQSGWNDRPLYMWDEWVSYANGTAARTDLDIVPRSETVTYMWEMAVYGSYVAILASDDLLDRALKFMLDRTSVLWYSSKNTPTADEYVSKIKSTNGLVDYWASVGFRFLENV